MSAPISALLAATPERRVSLRNWPCLHFAP